MKFNISVEKSKTVRPQWQLIIRNIRTKLQVVINHAELNEKGGEERLNGFRARLELVLNS